jgi:hypothetical protein
MTWPKGGVVKALVQSCTLHRKFVIFLTARPPYLYFKRLNTISPGEEIMKIARVAALAMGLALAACAGDDDTDVDVQEAPPPAAPAPAPPAMDTTMRMDTSSTTTGL